MREWMETKLLNMFVQNYIFKCIVHKLGSKLPEKYKENF
jgi:hypothetical protein